MPLKIRSMFAPELNLLISACRAAYGGRAVAPEDGATVDWGQLAKLAQRHRVEALCWQGLDELRRHVPSQLADNFSEATRSTIAQGMRAAAESRRLHEAFNRAGIDLLFVKGVTLGALAYPNPFLKMGMDIDLLIAPDQLRNACVTLRSSGYQPVIPNAGDDDRIQRWHARSKESVWRCGDIQIDLHTRLADQPAMISAIDMSSPRQTVTVAPGIDLPTLARDELFAYLCVHGASSAWFRLKWSCDLAALLHGKSEEEIEQLYETSQRLGAGRAAAQALLVADAMFNIGMSAPLRDLLRNDRVNRWLVNIALRQLSEQREPLDRRLGTFWIHASQLVLLPGTAHMAREFARQLRSATGNAQ